MRMHLCALGRIRMAGCACANATIDRFTSVASTAAAAAAGLSGKDRAFKAANTVSVRCHDSWFQVMSYGSVASLAADSHVRLKCTGAT